jgi:DNA repair protein RecN (Recombination protein N)
MLLHLSIRDFAIVDELDLDFDSAFTTLTGETGAGKSILIDALALALGERADANMLRAGAERAEVVAEFAIERLPDVQTWLRENELEGDPGRLLLRRVLDKNGRSRAFINGTSATVQQMSAVSESLIDIHGQHAHQSLVRADAQRAILDSHASLTSLAREVGEAWRAWQSLVSARSEYETNAAARDAEREQVAWQVEELRKLAPKAGEWDEISAEQSRLANAAGLLAGAQAAVDALTDSDTAAASAVSATIARLRVLVDFDAALKEPLGLLDSAEVLLDEAAHALRRYADRVELDPARLVEVERRVEALHSTARRLRTAPEMLPEHLERLSARLDALEIASNLDAILAQEKAAREKYDERAHTLSARRKSAATKLSKDVTAAMKELAMAGGRFTVALRPIEGGSAHGDEAVEFLVAANPGQDPRPLAKVASGGELSRISLAIQVITSKAAAVPTMIFDEVDSGIGGAVAEIVGKRLGTLGRERQVLCVTHLPQVAAQADHQWSVAKVTVNGAVRSSVAVLDEAARIEEVARMLGGTQITATTRKHAAEMLGAREVAKK